MNDQIDYYVVFVLVVAVRPMLRPFLMGILILNNAIPFKAQN